MNDVKLQTRGVTLGDMRLCIDTASRDRVTDLVGLGYEVAMRAVELPKKRVLGHVLVEAAGQTPNVGHLVRRADAGQLLHTSGVAGRQIGAECLHEGSTQTHRPRGQRERLGNGPGYVLLDVHTLPGLGSSGHVCAAWPWRWTA